MRSIRALVLVAAVAASGQGPVPQRHTERVTVARVLVDVRVLDAHGAPVRGLSAADFLVRIDGKAARIETAEWMNDTDEDSRAVRRGAAALPPPPSVDREAGRLIVFLFQKDLEPSRIVGLMRMLIDIRAFLDTLGPCDRVAVLSFDTHLRIWLDFTTRLDQVRHVLEHGILFEHPPPVEPAPPPSLMTVLDVVRAKRAASMQEALALLGAALEPLPGSKTIVLVGYGFGELAGDSFALDRVYGDARRALQAARASVFCLDVTDADWHTLEAGLKMTAEDTGGFYAPTHLFPELAVARVASALSGHYVLFVEVLTPVERTNHDLEVALTGGKKGTVLAKRSYADEPH